MPSVIVVVVVYNGMYWLDKCLGSLEKSTLKVDTIVVDNNSTDSSVNFIKNNFPNTIIIENDSNLGFGKANNIGIKYAINMNADFVFLLNQDAWIEPNTINNLVSLSKKDNSIGILSPLHYNGTGEKLDQNFANCLSQIYKSNLETNILERIIYFTEFVNAAAWLIPTRVIKKVGVFSSIFEHYGEDRDYCNRIRYHGFSIAIYPASKIYHDRKYSSNNLFRSERKKLNSVGLALLMDINHSLTKNYILLYLIRGRKILKNILILKPLTIVNELLVLFNLTVQLFQIKRNRINTKLENNFYV